MVRFGAFPTVSELLLPSILAHFATTRPTIEFDLIESEPDALVPLVQDVEVDVALVYEFDVLPKRWPSELRVSELLEEDLLLLLPPQHRLNAASEVTFADLADETWVSSDEQTQSARCLRRLAGSHGVEPAVAYRSNDYNVICRLVAAGLGVALIPALGVRPESGVTSRKIADVAAMRRVAAITRQSSEASAVSTVLEALHAAAARLAEHTDGVRCPEVL